jgi:ureidoacrylate peracid hydrolase
MAATDMMNNTCQLVKFARSRGIKVIHVPITFSDDYRELRSSSEKYGILANVADGGSFKASEWGGAFCEAVSPTPEEIVIQGKRGLCAFESTNLDFILRQNGIDTIAIGGFLTNCCVESTMRVAYEKGYKVVTLVDCTAATSMEAQEAAIKFTFPMFSIPLRSTELIAKFN